MLICVFNANLPDDCLIVMFNGLVSASYVADSSRDESCGVQECLAEDELAMSPGRDGSSLADAAVRQAIVESPSRPAQHVGPG